MTDLISKSHSVHPTGQPEARLFDNWIDPIETGVRERVRDWIEALIEAELEAALGRPRYGRAAGDEPDWASAAPVATMPRNPAKAAQAAAIKALLFIETSSERI